MRGAGWRRWQACERQGMTAEASSPAFLGRVNEKESCGAMRSHEQSASSVEGMQTRGRTRIAEQSAESEPKRPARRPVRVGWLRCVAKSVTMVSRLPD